VLGQSTGKEMSIIPPAIAKRTYQAQADSAHYYADAFFYAVYSQLKAKEPEFEH